MTTPWNDWYHCNGNTYGTWLRGDPRDFRERHHRAHIEGDYRRPPAAGSHDAMLARSRSLMKRSPVHLDAGQRRIAVEAMAEKLIGDSVELIAIAVDDHHFHLLGRFRDHAPRHWIGRAKMHASMLLRKHGLDGQVWAVRCRCLPITNRAHQVSVFNYIVRHAEKDAAVWTFRDPVPVLSPRPCSDA